MRLVFFGPPGAGKGTQARVTAGQLGIPQISTGDMFRAAMAAGTPLGREAKKHIDQGNLVPDAVTIGLVRERVTQADCARGYILDGFPRTLPQAEALDALLAELGQKLDGVVNLAVPDAEVVKRLGGRRVCRACGATYHVVFNPSPAGERCGACAGEMYQRSDDTEAAIRARLTNYTAQTAPLIGYYERSGRMHTIDGAAPIDGVRAALREVLDRIAAGRG